LVELPLRSVFEAPTIALLARKLEQFKETSTGELTAIPKLQRGTADVNQLLEQLARYSEEEVRTMLAEQAV
jgi:hypothetical protein